MDSMTLELVSWHLREKQTTSDDLLADAIDAHISRQAAMKQAHAELLQSYRDVVEQHAAMVAKLRELLIDLEDGHGCDASFIEGMAYAHDRLDVIVSAQPADPVKVDVQAIRNVVKDMHDVATFNHAKADDFKNRWADELDDAIGGKPDSLVNATDLRAVLMHMKAAIGDKP